MPAKFIPTKLPGVLLIEPDVFRDPRGFFFETYNHERYRQGGIELDFVQDNHSRSTRNTLRGLHAQWRRPQGKLVRVLFGEIWDVAVDMRKGSPTYRQWLGATLSAENHRQIWVPPGYLHGFCVISEAAEVEYKVTDVYDPGGELGVIWNDPDIGVEWPVSDPVLSKRDAASPRLRDVQDKLPTFGA